MSRRRAKIIKMSTVHTPFSGFLVLRCLQHALEDYSAKIIRQRISAKIGLCSALTNNKAHRNWGAHRQSACGILPSWWHFFFVEFWGTAFFCSAARRSRRDFQWSCFHLPDAMLGKYKVVHPHVPAALTVNHIQTYFPGRGRPTRPLCCSAQKMNHTF